MRYDTITVNSLSCISIELECYDFYDIRHVKVRRVNSRRMIALHVMTLIRKAWNIKGYQRVEKDDAENDRIEQCSAPQNKTKQQKRWIEKRREKREEKRDVILVEIIGEIE